jgi:transposase InsO family protein
MGGVGVIESHPPRTEEAITPLKTPEDSQKMPIEPTELIGVYSGAKPIDEDAMDAEVHALMLITGEKDETGTQAEPTIDTEKHKAMVAAILAPRRSARLARNGNEEAEGETQPPAQNTVRKRTPSRGKRQNGVEVSDASDVELAYRKIHVAHAHCTHEATMAIMARDDPKLIRMVPPQGFDCLTCESMLTTNPSVPTPAQRAFLAFKMAHLKCGHGCEKTTTEVFKEDNPHLVKHLLGCQKSFRCTGCKLGKLTQTRTFKASEMPKARRPLQRVHTDVNVIGREGDAGALYELVVLDEATRFVSITPLTSKAEVPRELARTFQRLERLSGERIACLRSDRGSEFCNKTVEALANSRGADIELAPVGHHVGNAMAERRNRAINEAHRLIALGLDYDSLTREEAITLWPHASKWIAYTQNRTPCKALGWITPFQAMTGKKPRHTSNLIFGARVVARVPEDANTLHKHDPRGEIGFFVGFLDEDAKIAKIYAPLYGKVVETPHFVVVDDESELVRRALDVPDFSKAWGAISGAFTEDSPEIGEVKSRTDDTPFGSANEVIVPHGKRTERRRLRSADEDEDGGAAASGSMRTSPQSGEKQLTKNGSSRDCANEQRKSVRLSKEPIYAKLARTSTTPPPRPAESATPAEKIRVQDVENPTSIGEAWRSKYASLWERARLDEYEVIDKRGTA